MPLRLFNSLGNEQQPFQPLVPGEVRIYVCGITPYDVTHLGHAFSYVQFDTLRRFFEWRGQRVHYVQNLTDIDDDMIMVSRREGGRPIPEIRDENDRIFRNDLDRLNVLRPTAYPFATDHIDGIIRTVGTLIAKGHAYETDGFVYFDVTSFPGYGKLNGMTLEQLRDIEDPEAGRDEHKRDPLDFLLWQRTPPGDPSWESPWGPGRPGWSIECSVMSMEALGEQIDIHGGGRDLIQMHHEHEIAQSESATGKEPFARFWMHNGMVKLDGTKMSKSLGNLVLARNLMEQFDPDHLRLYLLSEHYRSEPDYSDGALAALTTRYGQLRQAASAEADGLGLGGDTLEREFLDQMENDLDTPRTLDVLARAAARILDGTAGEGEASKLRSLLAVLGFAFAGAKGPATGHLEPTTLD